MNQKLFSYIFCIVISCYACSPVDNSSPLPEDFFVKFYGDRDAEKGLDVILTDNGYAVMGSTTSQNLTGRGGGDSDFYLVFTDFEGNELSSQVFGATSTDVNDATNIRYNEDVPSRIKRTSDGGFILIGTTTITTGEFANQATTDTHTDIIIYKLDAAGNIFSADWPVILSNNNTTEDTNEFGRDIVEDDDGGFVLVGTTSSVDQTKEGFSGNEDIDQSDIYLRKIPSTGIPSAGLEEWELTFGFVGSDQGRSIIKTASGFAILGATDVEKDGSGGGTNIIFATTNADGGSEQFRAFGSGDGNPRNDYPSKMQPTSDGGFIIVGTSSEDSEDITTDEADDDNRIILMKVTVNRTLTYFETLEVRGLDDDGGGRIDDIIAGNGNDIIELANGGFLVIGKRVGGVIDTDDSGEDIFLIKTNSFGQIVENVDASPHVLLDGLWEKNYGGLGNDQANSVIELSDGKLIVAGTNDFGGTNSTMMMLMKLNRNGDLLK